MVHYAVRRLPWALLVMWAVLVGLSCGVSAPEPRIEAPPMPPQAKKVEAPPVLDPFSETPNSEEEGSIYPSPLLEKSVNDVLALEVSDVPGAKRARWTDRADLKYLKRLEERFALTEAEVTMLLERGVVTLPKAEKDNYGLAFNEIYTSQLPLYVSLDAIFHAIYMSHANIMADLEIEVLSPALAEALQAMHEGLPQASPDYPTEVAGDLDIFLGVARTLLLETEVPSHFGHKEQIASLVSKATKGDRFERGIHLFGRTRTVDFTAYTPRGHYDKIEELKPFFRAAMWLSRLEFNMVSRSCRSSHPGDIKCDRTETPREAAVALALSDLAERTGAQPNLDKLDLAWSVLAGKREDISLNELGTLRRQASIKRITIDGAQPRVMAAIGDRFERTTRFHYMPQETDPKNLPAITTVLGPRIVADSHALMPVLQPYVLGRHIVSALDPAYMLGHDRALHYLEPRTRHDQWPKLKQQLAKGRRALDAGLSGPDLYSHWLTAIRKIATPSAGLRPSFMDTEVYQDLQLNSVVSAFGQLRHNYVLVAAQAYDQGGCTIPDAYVEPAPEVYRALTDYTRASLALVDKLAPTHRSAYLVDHFKRTAQILTVLERIARRQLAGATLSKEELAFLNKVTESDPPYGEGPEFNGWYFQLFYDSAHGPSMYGEDQPAAFKEAHFIADFQTSGYVNKIAYAGARAPRMGLFLIDTNGAPRVMVGPVARSYQHIGPLNKRLTDETALRLTQLDEPWAASYTAPSAKTPPLAFMDIQYGSFEEDKHATFKIRSSKRLRDVTLTLLNHHREPLASRTVNVGPRVTTVPILRTRPRSDDASVEKYDFAEVLQVQVGDYIGWFGGREGDGYWRTRGIGGMKPLPEE